MVSSRSIGIIAALPLTTWIALGAQSAAGTWAIVGVRIVDGSGNEPFTGTVVVEGGRIRAAGRTVEVPAGTSTIDGAGKTLLPGLIDLGVHVAGGSDAQATEQRRRAFAALLYSGVTTAAVGGPEAARFDVVARDAGRADAGPRILLLAHPAGAPSLDEAVAQRSPTARGGNDPAAIAGSAAAVTQANVTVVPELARAVGSPAGTASPLATEVAAAAGVDVSAQNPGAEWQSAANVVRALREARIRVAVRSDGGSASMPYGWSTHLATRLLVDAGLTPLEAVTAATSGGAWGLQLHSDRGFIAGGMRADLLMVEGDPTATIDDLARIDRIFLSGQEVDRQALRAVLAPPVVEAAPTSAAAPPATIAPPPARKPARGRRGRSEPAEAAPTAAAGVPPVAAVPRLDVALLDDFEREDERSPSGLTWITGTETADRPTTLVAGRVVRAFRDHALHLTARMGEAPSPYLRASLALSPDGEPRDVSRFRGLRFDARGEGRYRIVFVTRRVADGRFHESYFSGSPEWTPVSIPFASVGQNGSGNRVAWTGRDLVEIRFEASRDAGKLAWLELDNVRLY